MGRLIVDGNQVYEIDEACIRKRMPPKACGVYAEPETKQETKHTGNGTKPENNLPAQ